MIRSCLLHELVRSSDISFFLQVSPNVYGLHASRLQKVESLLLVNKITHSHGREDDAAAIP